MASKWELPWPICSKPYPLSASLFYQTLSASWLMFYICRHTSELLWFGFRSGNITLKWVTQIGGFPLHMKVMFTPYCHLLRVWGFPGGTGGKETANQYRRHKRSEFNRGVGREVSGSGSEWVGKIPWSRKLQPIPVFLPRKSYEQRSLAGYRPWGLQKVGHDWATEHINCSAVLYL